MKRKHWKKYSVIMLFLAVFALALSGCSGDDGATGATGATGALDAPGAPICACGLENDPDARFCKSCGAKL